jgi:hypothetical protein
MLHVSTRVASFWLGAAVIRSNTRNQSGPAVMEGCINASVDHLFWPTLRESLGRTWPCTVWLVAWDFIRICCVDITPPVVLLPHLLFRAFATFQFYSSAAYKELARILSLHLSFGFGMHPLRLRSVFTLRRPVITRLASCLYTNHSGLLHVAA